MSQAPTCKHGDAERGVFCPKCHPERYGELAASTGSLPGVESEWEFLIARWEARAEQCEQTSMQLREVAQGLTASYLEKARAFRDCIMDLRRHMEAKKVRQPEEND